MGAYPESRRGGAIDDQAGLQPFVLLVAVDVEQSGQGSEFLQHARRPDEEILNVVALERVLILGVGAAAADAQVLHRLQIKIHSRKLRQLAAQPADDLIGVDAPLV